MNKLAFLIALGAMFYGSVTASDAQLQTLVPLHGAWKYAYDGVDQGINWRARDFDDSEWLSGETLFGFETPGVYFEPFRTALPDPATRNYPITAYFRSHFDLGDPVPTNAIYYLTNWVDDGAVFYINGTEVSRLRVAADPVQYTNLATPPPLEGQTDVLTFTCTNCVLFAESNVLAVEVHQNSTNSSDIAFGSILVRERIQPLSIIDEPDDASVYSNAPARFEVVAAGSYPKYQWFRDGFRLVNQTNAVFDIPAARPGDQGAYYVVLTNAYGSGITSRQARLTVLADTVSPQVTSAVVQASALYTNKVELMFFETSGLLSSTARDRNNYQVHLFETGEELEIDLAQSAGNTVRLILNHVWDPSKTYIITVEGVRDFVGNYIKPNSQVVVQFTKTENLFRIDDPVWSFTGPPQEPTGWKEFDYFEDPNLWGRGPAILVCDTNAWEPCIGSRVTAVQCSSITHYFRTKFVNSNAPPSATLVLNATFDDGAIYYLNGAEIGRINMPAGAVNHSTRASANVADSNVFPPPCQPLTFAVTNLLPGTNLLTAELHQSSDLDVTFGLELDVQYVAPPRLEIPTINIKQSNQVIQVWWPGAPWRLERKTNLNDTVWERIESGEVPHTTPANGQQFFQVRQP